MKTKGLFGLTVFACAQLAAPVQAAEPAVASGSALRHFTAEELAAVPLPDTSFTETALIAADYDKYFYFQRDDTSFEQAYADVTECDALTSGISYYGGGAINPGIYAQYGVAAGAVGGAVGSIVADAIAGSAERRRIRRVNMRNCMGFKGYSRYGLEKEKWQAFNFEEGLIHEEATKRDAALKMQARRAAGPRPQQTVLSL